MREKQQKRREVAADMPRRHEEFTIHSVAALPLRQLPPPYLHTTTRRHLRTQWHHQHTRYCFSRCRAADFATLSAAAAAPLTLRYAAR